MANGTVNLRGPGEGKQAELGEMKVEEMIEMFEKMRSEYTP